SARSRLPGTTWKNFTRNARHLVHRVAVRRALIVSPIEPPRRCSINSIRERLADDTDEPQLMPTDVRRAGDVVGRAGSTRVALTDERRPGPVRVGAPDDRPLVGHDAAGSSAFASWKPG